MACGPTEDVLGVRNCLLLRYSEAILGWINRMEGPWSHISPVKLILVDDGDNIVTFPLVLTCVDAQF
jgi:hypothetical protein